MNITEINEDQLGRRRPLKRKTAGGVTIYKYENEYVIEGNFGSVNIDAKNINKVLKALSMVAQS